MTGSEDFYRGWEDYKRGFGHVLGDFWLGNELLRTLTFNPNSASQLRVDLWSFEGETAFAQYSDMYLYDEAQKYELYLGDYMQKSTAGNRLSCCLELYKIIVDLITRVVVACEYYPYVPYHSTKLTYVGPLMKGGGDPDSSCRFFKSIMSPCRI